MEMLDDIDCDTRVDLDANGKREGSGVGKRLDAALICKLILIVTSTFNP